MLAAKTIGIVVVNHSSHEVDVHERAHPCRRIVLAIFHTAVKANGLAGITKDRKVCCNKLSVLLTAPSQTIVLDNPAANC